MRSDLYVQTRTYGFGSIEKDIERTLGGKAPNLFINTRIMSEVGGVSF